MFIRYTLPPLRNPYPLPHRIHHQKSLGLDHSTEVQEADLEKSPAPLVSQRRQWLSPEAAEVLMPKKMAPLPEIDSSETEPLFRKHGLKMVEDITRERKLAILTCLMDGLDAACVEENSLRKCGPQGILYNF